MCCIERIVEFCEFCFVCESARGAHDSNPYEQTCVWWQVLSDSRMNGDTGNRINYVIWKNFALSRVCTHFRSEVGSRNGRWRAPNTQRKTEIYSLWTPRYPERRRIHLWFIELFDQSVFHFDFAQIGESHEQLPMAMRCATRKLFSLFHRFLDSRWWPQVMTTHSRRRSHFSVGGKLLRCYRTTNSSKFFFVCRSSWGVQHELRSLCMRQRVTALEFIAEFFRRILIWQLNEFQPTREKPISIWWSVELPPMKIVVHKILDFASHADDRPGRAKFIKSANALNHCAAFIARFILIIRTRNWITATPYARQDRYRFTWNKLKMVWYYSIANSDTVRANRSIYSCVFCAAAMQKRKSIAHECWDLALAHARSV